MKSALRDPKYLIAVSFVFLLLSCCHKNTLLKTPIRAQQDQEPVTKLVSPIHNTVITSGDSVKVELSLLNKSVTIDSVTVYDGRNQTVTAKDNPAKFYWSSLKSFVGQNALKITVFYNDSLHVSHSINLVILSDIVPMNYSYRIIKQYPHDVNAHTQGLVFDEGILYEGTGLEGKSSLRIVNINTGLSEKMVAIGSQYFGEGIALFRDQIYQLTYKTHIGFVYDKKTLERIRSFDFQIKEGWGLTTDGEYLIMSDGSAQLFYIEPDFFTQVNKIDVFDNKGRVESLNELEYINDKILANIFQQSYIVVIDPSTGKVTGKIELDDLIPEGLRGDYSKVLNGIAYNPQTGHLYVTGKDWPVLYEIELMPAL